MKIPTLVGIALIITILTTIGVVMFYRSKEQGNSYQISDLEVVNLGNTTATIIWQTKELTEGEVLYGESEQLNKKAVDNRDRRQMTTRLIHFVTINDLKPNTRYFYRVVNNSQAIQKTLEFKTANAEQKDDGDFSFPKPIRGAVLNTTLNPIDESLIFLNIPGAQKMVTFSSTAGNFILPLKTVLNTDLNKVFIISPDTPASLTIVKGSLKSNIHILVSESTVNLPPITIGSNLDLTNFKPQKIGNIIFNNIPKTLDFNGDGSVNSLDLAMLRETAKPGGLTGTSGKSKFDVNGDGEVNQLDVDEFSRQVIVN